VIVRSQLVRDIAEERIADCGVAIPPEHVVDSLGELSTRSFVNAAGVDPDILETLRFCKARRVPDLGETLSFSAIRWPERPLAESAWSS
jgi:hypothetical protein